MEIRVLFFLVLVDKISKTDASCKTMKFNKDFPGKSLKNFVFKRIQAKESFCTNLCYMHDGCLSVNYVTEEQTCELSESDHVINPEYWEDTPGYAYYSAENTCKCPKHKICRHNFILNTFKCECNSKYPGANCTITPSPSSTDTASSLASFSSLVSSSPSLSSVSSVPSSLLSDTSSPSLSLPASPSSSVSLSSVVSASNSLSSVFSSSTQTPTPTLTSEFLSPSTSVSSLSLSPSPSSMVSSSFEYPSSAPESPSLSTSVLSSISPSLSSLSCASASLSHSSGCQLNYPRASQDDYIEAFPNFPQDLKEITLSFWLKVPSSLSNTLGIFSYQSGVHNMSVLMQDTSQVEFTLNGGQKILKSDFVRDDTWQHIAITLKDDGHLKLYTNGKKTADENNMSARYIKRNNDGKIRLGKIDGKTDFIQGSIAELYIWKVDLSGDDVKTVFDFKCGPIGNFKEKELISSWDAIVNSACYHGEVKKSCPTTCPGFTGVCQLDFPSGSQDDYVEAFPNFSQDFDELSLSFWLKVPSSYKDNLAIVSYRTQDESSDMSVVMKDTSEVEFKINGGGKTLSSSFVRDNTWQNIAITLKDDGKVKMYRNGQKISEESGMNGKIKKDPQGKLQLGKKYDGADPTFVIQGSLAELYMWDKDLSGGDVTSIFGFKCGSMGNFKSNELILSWDTILQSQGLKGQVKKTCPITCPG